ncbi:hypothetical protein [Vagococcus salmoninarum]|uniref:hypothetical protein n=1 Tax=Vagococcus salmoninarum TaxID=2739 RepID=UPI001880779E|nr:hypothetical protein [Vagococcus salmoninarum]MBE9387851.1 hypothetical protein [Vagococcus salmoninarum]
MPKIIFEIEEEYQAFMDRINGVFTPERSKELEQTKLRVSKAMKELQGNERLGVETELIVFDEMYQWYPFQTEALGMAIKAMSRCGLEAASHVWCLTPFERLASDEKKKGNKRNGTFDRQQAFGGLKRLKKRRNFN